MKKSLSVFKRGFTLVEMLTVLAVISVLLGLLLPAVQAARGAARRASCQNQMRQIGMALLMHADAKRKLPPGTNTDEKRTYESWCVQVLPYLEQSNEYEKAERGFAAGGSVFNVINHPLLQQPNLAFSCPEDSRVSESAYAKHSSFLAGLTSYLGCSGTDYLQQDGVLFSGSAVRLSDVTDGLSNTLLIGERPPSPNNDLGWWYAGVGVLLSTRDRLSTGCLDHTLGVREKGLTPYGNCSSAEAYFHYPSDRSDECNANFYWSLHPGGGNFVRCDGSVQFLTYASASVLDQLATRNGGDVVE